MTWMEVVPLLAVAVYVAIGAYRDARRERAWQRWLRGDDPEHVSQATLVRLRQDRFR
jgi:hypothetical protein